MVIAIVNIVNTADTVRNLICFKTPANLNQRVYHRDVRQHLWP